MENLGDDRWKLSDGRIVSGDEFQEALLEQFRQEDLKPEAAISWALRNRDDLEYLYSEISRASARGLRLKDKPKQEEVKAAIAEAHGRVLGETFAIAVGDVEPMSAVTLAALMIKFDETEIHYRYASQEGLTPPQALVKAPILIAPHFIEGATPKNFVQALIVGSIVKWIPIRAYHDGKRFFVNPTSKDYNVLERLEATPEGQDWIDMAYARSEHDDRDTIPDF